MLASNSTAWQDWYLNLGASNHVTSNLESLSLYSPYTSTSKVAIGNGDSLTVKHTGSGNLSTSHHNFKLKNIFHVPSISITLLYVHKLAKYILKCNPRSYRSYISTQCLQAS